MRDYDKGNFFELDDFMNQVAGKYGVHIGQNVSSMMGCTKSEIEDAMKSTIRQFVPKDDLGGYEKQIDRLLA